jgi:hypothetical protein
MLTYGIPVITSNINSIKNVTQGFSNVFFIENDNPVLPKIEIDSKAKINKGKFSPSNSVLAEIDYILNGK